MEPKNTVCIGILALLLALLSLPSVSGAQGIPHNISPILGPSGQPRPGATISFCQHPANSVPCSNFANAYSDIALTILINQTTNPIRTDGLGNVPALYAAPGIYDFEQHGLTDDVLIEKYLKPLLNAKETKFFQKDGVVTDTRDVEALGTRTTALDMALKLGDKYPQRNEGADAPTTISIEIVMVGGQ